MPRFAKDQIVIASTSTQRLRAGAKYRVAEVHVRSLPFGEFVDYDLVALNPKLDNVAGLVNGHLLLREDDAPAATSGDATGVDHASYGDGRFAYDD